MTEKKVITAQAQGHNGPIDWKLELKIKKL